MAWPTSSISKTNLLDGTKNPDLARADLLLLTQAVNDIIASRGAAGGVAAIGSDGTLPTSQLNPSAVLSAIVGVSGAGSLLDADLLDGLQGSAYATIDGLRDFNTSGNNAVNVRHSSAATSTVYEGLRVYHDTSNTPVAGFGAAIGWRGSAAGGSAKFGDIAFSWTDPTVLSVDSQAAIRTMNAGALEDALVCNAGYLELRQISSPAGDAASGRTWIYAKTDGLYVKRPGVAELLLGAGGGGVSDHGALTGLADDDHNQYLLTTGARALTGVISFATYPPSYDELGGNPTGPGTGKWSIFFKSDGVYTITGSSTVVGPLGVGGGGVSDHGALTGLADDDHTQYLLRQPAADYVLNEAGSDYDFRIEGVSTPNLFNLDAGSQQVTINGTAASNSSCRFAVIGSSGGAIFAKANGGPCFKADSYTAGATGLLVTTTHASGTGATISTATNSRAVALFDVADTSATLGSAAMVRLTADAATNHTLLQIRRKVSGVYRSVIEAWGDGVYLNGGATDDCRLVMYDNGATGDDLLHVTPFDNQVGIGREPAAGTARLQVQASSDIPLAVKVAAVTTQAGLLAVTSSGTTIEAQATTGTGIKSGVTATAGTAAYLYRTVGSAGGGAVVKAEITHASDNGIVAQLTTAGTGDLLKCVVGGTTTLRVAAGGELVAVQRTAASAPASSYWALWAEDSSGWWTRASTGDPRNFVAVVPGVRDGGTVYFNGTSWNANDNWLYDEAISGNKYTTKTLLYGTNSVSEDNITFGHYITTEEITVTGASTNAFSLGPGTVMGAFVKVTTGVTGATKFHLGTAADPTLILADVAATVGTKTDSAAFRPRPCLYLPTSTTLVLTSADAAFTGGAVHVVVQWIGCRYN